MDIKKYLNESNDIATYYNLISKNKEFLKEDILNPLSNNIMPPNTLVLVGNGDHLKDECKEYEKIYKTVKCSILPFSEHGFLNSMDNDLEEEIKIELTKFLKAYTE